MGFHKHFETNVLMIYGDETGTGGWVGVSGGSGTVALSGGGIPVAKCANSNDFTDMPLPLPVYAKPSDSDASYLLLTVPSPDGGIVGLRNAWVIYWAED